MEDIQGENKGKEGIVNPGDSFNVVPGTPVLLGRNPEASPEKPGTKYGYKSIKISGLPEDDLEYFSRAVVMLGIDLQGKLWMRSMTGSNEFTLVQKQEGSDKTTETSFKGADNTSRFITQDTVIKIKTEKGTVIKLSPEERDDAVDPATSQILIHTFRMDAE